MVTMQHKADGEYEVIQGGTVYTKSNGRVVPLDVKRGEIHSASTICEWCDNGCGIRVR